MSEDVFQNTSVLSTCWSNDVVIKQLVGGGQSCTVDAIAPANISVTGTVTKTGDEVQITAPASYGPTFFSAVAVFPVPTGLVLQDQFGDYLLILSEPVRLGETLDSVTSFGQYGSGGTTNPCIAAGTAIRGLGKWIPVESLKPGDVAVSPSGEAQKIVWIGHKAARFTADSDPATLPVLFTAGCISPGCPRTDLVLSPDHAVFVAGCLVPAYRLCNGASVRRLHVSSIVYYHVELVRHGIVLAEGMPVESYLDVGNRCQFENGTGEPQTYAGPRDKGVWERCACAPLLTDPAAIALLRQNLRRRALQTGYRVQSDPGMVLRADGSPAVHKMEQETLSLMLPKGTRQVTLDSLTSRPSEVLGNTPDHRCLGVAISDLAVGGNPVPIQDDSLFTTGWHPWEGEFRWTCGRAILPVTPLRTTTLLTLRARTWLPYWLYGTRPEVRPAYQDIRGHVAAAVMRPDLL